MTREEFRRRIFEMMQAGFDFDSDEPACQYRDNLLAAYKETRLNTRLFVLLAECELDRVCRDIATENATEWSVSYEDPDD